MDRRDDFYFWLCVVLSGALYLGVAIERSGGGLLPSWAQYGAIALLIFFGCSGVIARYRQLKGGRA